jgi:hypothetical protein
MSVDAIANDSYTETTVNAEDIIERRQNPPKENIETNMPKEVRAQMTSNCPRTFSTRTDDRNRGQ